MFDASIFLGGKKGAIPCIITVNGQSTAPVKLAAAPSETSVHFYQITRPNILNFITFSVNTWPVFPTNRPTICPICYNLVVI